MAAAIVFDLVDNMNIEVESEPGSPMAEEDYCSPRGAPHRHINGDDDTAAFGRIVSGVAWIADGLQGIVDDKRRVHEDMLAWVEDNVWPEKICETPEHYFFPTMQPPMQWATTMELPVEPVVVFMMPVMVYYLCDESMWNSGDAADAPSYWWGQ